MQALVAALRCFLPCKAQAASGPGPMLRPQMRYARGRDITTVGNQREPRHEALLHRFQPCDQRMLSLLLATALATGANPAPWHHGLDWHGVHVGIEHDAQGRYTLAWPYGQRVIAPQPLHVDTASPLFDGLFAMAQDDLSLDSVDAIRDGAFDHGRPIPCHCFETGLKWPYRVDARPVLRDRPGTVATGPDTRAQRPSLQALGPAQGRAVARTRFGSVAGNAGHRVRRQLADQHRSRGVVPGRPPPAR